MMTDPVADMLTRIRNALQAKHPSVSMPASNTRREIARILREEGYIQGAESTDEGPQGTLEIKLKYVGPRREGHAAITGIERVSKPGRRVYRGKSELPSVLNGLGVAVVSTSRGLLTDRQCREQGIGGEIVCRVW